MLKHFHILAISAIIFSAASCNQIEPLQATSEQVEETQLTTRAYDEKSPTIAVYVETNDVNPLNAGDYTMSDGSTFIDIVELFASNIHKDDNGDPTLFLNDKLTNVLENGGAATYVAPLQAKGIKVLLTVLGDWQGIGVANMTDAQSTKFATILAYVVNRYGLDGIGFDDEYANYSGSLVSNSYAQIIKKLHALMPSDKLITVFDWGNTCQIDAEASACIDYAYHGYFGSYVEYTSRGITGMTASKWSPISFNLGNYNSTATAESYAERASDDGYGAMMCFNLCRRSERDPLSMFQALSNGAYGGSTISCSNGNRARTAGSVASGYNITYEMAQ